jgi:hypothetical protein
MASTLLLALFAAIIGTAYSVGLYVQCAGEGYGNFPCDAGLICFRRNRYYSSCQYSCPLNQGWECEAYLVATPPPAIVAGWGQCGGDGWYGARACAAGFACYARTALYSQCRPINDCPLDWACRSQFVATTTAAPVGPILLDTYARCNGVANAICRAGLGCFRYDAAYAECRPYCPATWACETDVAGLEQQCGGQDYVGVTRCAEGLSCYARSKWYSHCAAACPGTDWICAK